MTTHGRLAGGESFAVASPRTMNIIVLCTDCNKPMVLSKSHGNVRHVLCITKECSEYSKPWRVNMESGEGERL